MKRIIFWVSLFFSLMYLIMVVLVTNYSCEKFFFCEDAYSLLIYLIKFTFPLLFLFSVITYRMKEVVINRWLKFVYIWVPLTVILVFLAPEYDSSLLPLEKGTVALTMSGLFVFISLLIILVSYLRKTKQ